MAGYTRQSTADIIPTATVRAAPLNAEYNALRDAFAASGGHKHDGTAAEGEYVPLIADLDANNKVQVNTGANTVDFYVEVSGVPVQQISVRDGVIRPITDNDIDLGATGAEFKDLYIDGIGYIDTLAVHENATVAGTLNVTGVITAPAGLVADIIGNITGDVTGNVTGDLTGDVTSTGTSTFADIDTVDLAATGTTVITSGDINSGTIDNSVIGSATPAAGTFTTLNANTSLTAATADINGGTIDGATIGATSHTTGKFTTLQSTGQATLNTVDINGGNIDGTVIGAVGTAAGSFTTLSTSGQATLATADINGGTIDGATIGASSASTGAFTTVTASGGVTANLTGNVTGNVTGSLSGGTVTGNVTGDLTGNVTSAGTSTFNNVTIDGTLNMNAGTTATITNLTSPTNTNDAATKGYVDTQVSNLVDSAPGTLDTLNELAAALGDDPDFATTVTNSIATKLPLAGGTMTGAIAMSTNKITGAGDPTAAQDVATKAYVDTQRDTRVAKAGDTMSGNLAMGSNKVTGLAAPTDANDATSKTYVDGILGSATAASASAAAAATSESNAATSETNASNSASAAATSEANAAASYDNFDDRYLGAKSTAPTVDNDGDALIVGALYFNNTTNIMYVYSSGGWQAAGSSVNGTSDRNTYTATAGQTVFAATYDTGYVDVYLNGVKLVAGTDFTATNGTSITLATGAAVNDVVDIVAYGTFVLADHYTKLQSDARYVEVAGDTMTGNLSFGDNDKAIFGAGSDLSIYHDSAAGHSYIDDVGAGVLKIRSNGTGVDFESTGGEALAQFVTNGAVTLYHNNNPKLATTSTGIDVTGTVTADGLTVDGATRINDSEFFIADNSTGTTAKLSLDVDTTNGARIRTTINGAAAIQPLGIYTGSTLRQKFDNNGDISFYEDTGTTAKFFWDASAESLGIGTSSPNSGRKLHVFDSGDAILRVETTTASGDGRLELVGDSAGVSQIRFGDEVAVNVGLLTYTHSENSMAFNTNGSERLRLDSSGNLLVGTTSSNGGITATTGGGFVYRPTKELTVHRQGVGASSPVAIFNQTGDDGQILDLRKDGTTVGSIGTTSASNFAFYSPSEGGLETAAVGILPMMSGVRADNQTDLGFSGARFKDLYLSGGVYLGGTGAANKLDDYEEGTWTANLHFPPDSLTNNDATEGTNRYTKVGNFVTVQGKITLSASSTSTSALRLSGLPFTSSSNTAITGSLICRNGASFSFVPYAFSNSTELHFYQISSSGSWNQVAYNEVGAVEMHFEISYFAT